MKGRTQAELEASRPSIDCGEAAGFCLAQLYRDRDHVLDDEVCHNLTYEELIGALLLARNIANDPDQSLTASVRTLDRVDGASGLVALCVKPQGAA